MSKKVILIADDEPHILELFRMTLGEDDYDFLEAKNGKEAISLARAYQPDIVLLDIRMPSIDGMEAAKQFTSLHPAPTVIFTTAYSEHALEAFEHQAVDYLLKPIRKERLEHALKRAYHFSKKYHCGKVATNKLKKSSMEYGHCQTMTQVISMSPRYLLELMFIFITVLLTILIVFSEEEFSGLPPILGLYAVASMRLIPTQPWRAPRPSTRSSL